MSNPNFIGKEKDFKQINTNSVRFNSWKPLSKEQKDLKSKENSFFKEMAYLLETKFDGKYISLAEVIRMMAMQYNLSKGHFERIIRKHDLQANKNYYICEKKHEIKTKTFECRQCGETKGIKQFQKEPGNKSGHSYICKSCKDENSGNITHKTPKQLVFTELFIIEQQLKVHNMENAKLIMIQLERIKELLTGGKNEIQ